jgi:integrase
MSVLDFFEDCYRPAKHPGDPLSRTCQEYRSQLRNLSRPRQFVQWLAERGVQCDAASKPALYRCFEIDLDKRFRSWRKSQPSGACKVELRQRFETDLLFGSEPAWWAKVEHFSDALIVEAMSFLVDAGRERTTANKLRAHANSVWRFSQHSRLVRTLPENDKLRVNKRRPIALLPDQLQWVIDAAGQEEGQVGGVPAREWFTGAILFIYSLGVRISAAMQVPTVNLDLVRGDVLVPCYAQKQHEDQRLDLFASVVERLRRWKLAERGITTVLGDWPYGIDPLRDRFHKILVRAGLFPSVDDVPREFGFHVLRKTLASQLYANAGLHVASQRLGHSSLQVTEAYIDDRYRSDPQVRDLLPDPRPLDPSPGGSQLRIFTGEAG